MALHEVIEKHEVTILGQQIKYTNKYITYTKGTIRSYKPSPSLYSCSGRIFKYDYEHQFAPTLVVLSGQKYIVPTYQKVHPQTELSDINWIKPQPKNQPVVEKNEWLFESSSDPGHFYRVRQSGTKYTCNCPGVWRSKDRRCKHIKQVENDNK